MRLMPRVAIGLTVVGLTVVGISVLSSVRARKPSFPAPVVVYHFPPVKSLSSAPVGASSSSAQPVSSGSSSFSSETSSSIPASLLIEVPFAPQSPYAIWDPLHEEACEEMALIMVHHFLAGTPLSLADAETEVQQMIAWERNNGYADDVSVAELGAIANGIYGYHFRVLTNVTADTLRLELAAGNPVIIPAFGRALGNPYFSGAGPFYHMLVATGYTAKGFITNDPGTKRGEQYWYSTDVLLSALHDWIGVKEQVPLGPKNALVVEK
jgi:hypothetical protein